jgi:hypothetical protein
MPNPIGLFAQSVAPKALGIGAGAGLSGILGTLGSFAATPLGGMIIASVGTELLGKFMGNKQSPYEKNMAGMVTQLQQQAGGMPTAATKAQGNLLNREVTRAMQSTAASSTRSMPGGRQFGQTPSGQVAQNRLQGARIEGLAQIMGNSQQQAQDQLMKVYGMQGDMEEKELASKSRVNQMLGAMLAGMTKPELAKDPYEAQIFEMLKGFAGKMSGYLDTAFNPQNPTQTNTGNRVTNVPSFKPSVPYGLVNSRF